MTEKAVSAIDAILQAANHKATNFTISASLVVTGQVTKEVSKAPDYISLADIGLMGISFASWLQIVGGIWILLQILNFCGAFKLLRWAYNKLRGE